MKGFLEFIASIFDVPANTLSLTTAYESIPQWDSLMQLRLVGEMEDKYGVDIPIDKVPEIKTLGDFYAYVKDGK